jgi:phenylacetate-CoA ligase
MRAEVEQANLPEPIETASRDELAALQLERLKWTLSRVYDRVPHYRAKFDAAGVHPEDLKTLADLARFPFTTKADLRDNYPFGLFATPLNEVVRLHASSGTTGRPTVVGYSRADLDMWAQVMARSLRAAGCRAGMRVHNAFGYGLFTGGMGYHAGAERLGCTVTPVSGGMTERQAQLIADFKPDVIMGTPSYMLAILDEMRRTGSDPRRCSLKIGFFGAEPWTNAMREELERELGIDAFDLYGLSEVIGPGVSCETIEDKNGPTIWEDHFYPEVVEPATGAVLPDGEHGELVLTSLTKEAMPVIRYRTRDLTRLAPATARTMRRMEKVTGRSDDMIILRGVNIFPSQIEEQILKCRGLSPHYALELGREGRLDTMNVLVEARSDAADPATRAQQAKALIRHIKAVVGVSVRIDVVDPGAIDRSIGKAKRVLDLRPKD